jgi:predicted  nucleic acid-binding Zn-ribbon protein
MAEGYEERADKLEKEADTLADRSERVEGKIDDAREDWESKKSSNQAPGATDPERAAPGGLGEDDEGA